VSATCAWLASGEVADARTLGYVELRQVLLGDSHVPVRIVLRTETQHLGHAKALIEWPFLVEISDPFLQVATAGSG